MSIILSTILAVNRYIPHGHCYLWNSPLVGLHVASDALIALAYYSIPLTLVYFVRKRADLPYASIFLLFGAFIVSCGTTHVMEIWTLWHPNYWGAGTLKFITAVISLYTAIALIPIVPKALAIPSPKQLKEEIADRKQIEQALRNSQLLLDGVLNSSLDGVMAFESVRDELNNIVDFQWLLVNPAAEKIVGCTKSKLLGKHLFKELPGSREEELFDIYVRVVETGEPAEREFFYEHDGIKTWFQNTAVKLEDGFAVTFRDISDRKQTEIALRQSEERYRLIVGDQTELIIRFDLDGKLTFVNQACCRYFEQKWEQLIGNSYQLFIFPEEREKVARHIDTLILDNPLGTIEYRVIANGEIRWMQWIYRVIFDEKGQFIEFQSVGRDISDRKKIEIALQQSEERFRLAFNDAAIGVALVSLEGQFLQVNRSLCEIVGYSEEELQATDFQTITYPDDLETDFNYVRQLLAGEIRTCQIEKRYIHKLGYLVWILLCVSLVRDEQGRPLYFIAQIQDISDRKIAEAQIAASLEEKNVLLKEIHHRVKNNLQIICSLLNLQSRSLKDFVTIELFKETQNRIQSMALIHEKLYQSKNLSKIDLAGYIRDLVNNLLRSYAHESSKFSIKTELYSDLVLDIDTIIPCGLIVNELISNAIKYAFTFQKKGEIYIQARSDDSQSLILIVSDNGKGLPVDFELENSRTLGLKLVKSLTNQLRGTIQVISPPGTKFIITLTRIKVH
jgi:PAS domain S-box-containing protein